MVNKKLVKIIYIFIILLIIFSIIYVKFFKKNNIKVIPDQTGEINYNSNLIKEVEYSTKDKDGNEYLIKAEEGEIDFSSSINDCSS